MYLIISTLLFQIVLGSVHKAPTTVDLEKVRCIHLYPLGAVSLPTLPWHQGSPHQNKEKCFQNCLNLTHTHQVHSKATFYHGSC